MKKHPLEKPPIIQDQFENKTSALDRETDRGLPRNRKQIISIKSPTCNTRKNEDEIANNTEQLLEKSDEAIKSDPSSNHQHFLQGIFFFFRNEIFCSPSPREGRICIYVVGSEKRKRGIRKPCAYWDRLVS